MATTSGQGYFLVIEGLDGSGTTTQVEMLGHYFQNLGVRVVTTKEPTDTEIGASIRRFLQGKLTLTPPAQALAFAADRLIHLHDEVIPAIEEGTLVISDRYVLSSIAYQSIELESSWVAGINREALQPDLTVFLDVTPEKCIERLSKRGGPIEHFERLESLRTIERYYRRGIDAARMHGEKVFVVDGSVSAESVGSQILGSLDCSDLGRLVPSAFGDRKISRSRGGAS